MKQTYELQLKTRKQCLRLLENREKFSVFDVAKKMQDKNNDLPLSMIADTIKEFVDSQLVNYKYFKRPPFKYETKIYNEWFSNIPSLAPEQTSVYVPEEDEKLLLPVQVIRTFPSSFDEVFWFAYESSHTTLTICYRDPKTNKEGEVFQYYKVPYVVADRMKNLAMTYFFKNVSAVGKWVNENVKNNYMSKKVFDFNEQKMP